MASQEEKSSSSDESREGDAEEEEEKTYSSGDEVSEDELLNAIEIVPQKELIVGAGRPAVVAVHNRSGRRVHYSIRATPCRVQEITADRQHGILASGERADIQISFTPSPDSLPFSKSDHVTVQLQDLPLPFTDTTTYYLKFNREKMELPRNVDLKLKAPSAIDNSDDSDDSD